MASSSLASAKLSKENGHHHLSHQFRRNQVSDRSSSTEVKGRPRRYWLPRSQDHSSPRRLVCAGITRQRIVLASPAISLVMNSSSLPTRSSRPLARSNRQQPCSQPRRCLFAALLSQVAVTHSYVSCHANAHGQHHHVSRLAVQGGRKRKTQRHRTREEICSVSRRVDGQSHTRKPAGRTRNDSHLMLCSQPLYDTHVCR